MSKRDGRMYMAERLSKVAEAENGIRINFDTVELAGYINVFWTKTAARKMYGRNVHLREIWMPTVTDQGEER